MNNVKTLFLGHAEHVLPKWHFWASKFSKSSHWPQTLYKTVKKCAFYEKYKTLFSGHAQHGQKFLRVKVFKKTPQILFSALSWNLYKTSCAARVGQIAFWASKFSKWSQWPEISPKSVNTALFIKNSAKRSFQIIRSTFWPNRIFKRQSFQNGETRLKFSSELENSALSMKIVQNAFFRSCAARFGQIAVLTVKFLKNVTLAWNSFKKGKTVRFSLKLYKTLFSGHAEHVLAKSHFGASKLSKSWN